MRKPLFSVATPFPPTPVVTLYDNTWVNHIEANHPEMAGLQPNLQATLSSPTYVCEATSPGYFMFVNHTDVDSKGAPHVVCVSTSSDTSGSPVVTTSYFSKKHKDLTKVKKVWP